MPSFSNITNSIHYWFNQTFNPTWALIFEMVIAGIAVISLFAILGLILVLMERKSFGMDADKAGP